MSDRPTDGGEGHADNPAVTASGRCRITRAEYAGQPDKLLCVAPDNAYRLVEFQPGEEHRYDRLTWRNKNGTHGHGYVIRTDDGDAYLMPHLFAQYCEVLAGAGADDAGDCDGMARGVAGQQESAPAPAAPARPTATPPTPTPVRRVRVVNVKGLNKPEQRRGVVYVGRKFAGWPAHPLHNPFKPVAGDAPGTCLAKYRRTVLARLTLDEDLAALWAETGEGKRPLGCWCCNATAGDGSAVVCHAQVLAELLMERFGGQ